MQEDIEEILRCYQFESSSVDTRRIIVSHLSSYMATKMFNEISQYHIVDITGERFPYDESVVEFEITYSPLRSINLNVMRVCMVHSKKVGLINYILKKHTLT